MKKTKFEMCAEMYHKPMDARLEKAIRLNIMRKPYDSIKKVYDAYLGDVNEWRFYFAVATGIISQA